MDGTGMETTAFSAAAATSLFVDPGDAFTAPQLGQDIGRPQSVPSQHYEAMKPEIGCFADQVQFITVLRREQGLGRLLTYLLEDEVVPLGEQAGDVRAVRVVVPAARDGVR